MKFFIYLKNCIQEQLKNIIHQIEVNISMKMKIHVIYILLKIFRKNVYIS